MRRSILFLLVSLGLIGLAGSGGGVPSTTLVSSQIEVIEVGGLLDDAILRYLRTSIAAAASAGREVAIVQLNSPGVVGSLADLTATAELLSEPPLPVVVWLGPAPAVAGGGAAQLLAAAPLRTAAPGTTLQNWSPAVAGTNLQFLPRPAAVAEDMVVSRPVDGVIDLVVPSIRQLVQELDGLTVTVGGVSRALSTITSDVPGENGGDRLTTIPVSFTQPGLFHRFLHLSARPEAAFFFLASGLTLAAFEFFTLGPGLGAALSGLCLLLAGYGMAVLPTRSLAVAATTLAIGLFAVSNQKGGVIGLGIPATLLLAWAGFNFSTGAPQVRPAVPGVAFSILAVLFFFLLAIPTVGRARFSTQTIGRTGLIGRLGTALVDFAPDGIVEIDGARWPATAHREAGIKVGSAVVVTSVEGARVEVAQS